MKLSEIRTKITNDDPYIESLLIVAALVAVIVIVSVALWLI